MKYMLIFALFSLSLFAQQTPVEDNDGDVFGGGGTGTFKTKPVGYITRGPASIINKIDVQSYQEANTKCLDEKGKILGKAATLYQDKVCHLKQCAKSVADLAKNNVIASYTYCYDLPKIQKIDSYNLAVKKCSKLGGEIHSVSTMNKNDQTCHIQNCSMGVTDAHEKKYLSRYEYCSGANRLVAKVDTSCKKTKDGKMIQCGDQVFVLDSVFKNLTKTKESDRLEEIKVISDQ